MLARLEITLIGFLTMVLSLPALGADLTDVQLKKLAIDNIDRILPVGSFPSKCIVRYSLRSSSETAPPKTPPNTEEIKALLDGIKTTKDLEALNAKLDKVVKDSKIERTTGALEFRSGGVLQKETLFEVSSGIESSATMFENIAIVMNAVSDRLCGHSTAEPSMSAPVVEKTTVPSAHVR